MVDTIKQALTTREIRRKLEWMVGIIFLTRVISMFPIPGVDVSVFKQWMATHSNDALNLFSTFTGGSFENFSVFALGITPLITAQIIIQLLTGVIPSLSKLQKKGEHGNKVMRAITDISAIVLAAVQSCLMAIGFEKSGMISSNHMILSVAIVTISMTAGTGIMIWLSDVLTKRSIGNGVSILLMTNIVSGLPGELNSLFKELTSNKTKPIAVTSVIAAVIIITIMIVVIVYMTEGYHPLAVQYSQKMSQSGEDAETGQIPIKVGISGVMPVIFASSLMAIPQLIATITGKGYGSGFSKVFLNMMSQKNWFNGEEEIYSLGLLIYLFLIIFFAFFYLPLSFNGAEVADTIRRFGGYVPGVRAGQETEFYITKIARHLTSIGVVMLICVTVIPMAICGAFHINTNLSGTSLIIVIGVVTEIIQQIRLELAGRNYCGLFTV